MDSLHAASSAVRGEGREERLQETWRSLFTEPNVVGFAHIAQRLDQGLLKWRQIRFSRLL